MDTYDSFKKQLDVILPILKRAIRMQRESMRTFRNLLKKKRKP